MKINNISNSPSFNAHLSRGMQKMIADARKVCTAQESPFVEDAVKILKECCPDLVLSATKRRTHILVPSTGKGNLYGYLYGTINSRNTGNAVNDVRCAAAGLEFMHIGGIRVLKLFGEKPKFVNASMIKDFDGKFTKYYEKWIDFFKNSNLPKLK